MKNHAAILANLTKSEKIMQAMGKEGQPVLKSAITIVADMKKVETLRAAAHKLGEQLAAKQKDSDGGKAILDAAGKKFDDAAKDYGKDADELDKLCKLIKDHPGWDDKKLKTASAAIDDLRRWAINVHGKGINSTDPDSFKPLLDQLAKVLKDVPKKEGAAPYFPGEPAKLFALTAKLEKKLTSAEVNAKVNDGTRAEYAKLNVEIIDLKKKIKLAQDSLGALVGKVGSSLASARDQDLQVEMDQRTPESLRMVAAVAGVLNDAIDYYGATDPAKFLAQP